MQPTCTNDLLQDAIALAHKAKGKQAIHVRALLLAAWIHGDQVLPEEAEELLWDLKIDFEEAK